jgi:hypothetical protein
MTDPEGIYELRKGKDQEREIAGDSLDLKRREG